MAEAPDVPTVDAAKAAELVLEQKAPYLDVRTQQEFAAGHAKGAINVPYMFSKPDGSMEVNKNFADEASKALPDKDAHVVVSCQKGRRGAFATKLLKDRGFGKIFNLGGGMNEWAAAGLPTQM